MPTPASIQAFLSDLDMPPSIYKISYTGARRLRSMDPIIVLPIEGETFFPYMHIMLTLELPELQDAVMEAVKRREPVFVVNLPELPNNVPSEELPEDIDLLKGMYGTPALIKDVNKDDNGVMRVFVITGYQAKLEEVWESPVEDPDGTPLILGKIKETKLTPIKSDKEWEEEFNAVLNQKYEESVRILPEEQKKKLLEALRMTPPESLRYLHVMIQNTFLNNDEKQELLNLTSLAKRRDHFLRLIERSSKRMSIREEIARRTSEEFGQRQKEDFIRAQIRTMQDEIGDTYEDEEILALRDRASQKVWSEEAKAAFEKELKKLQRFNPTSPEYALQYSWIDTFLSLPWNNIDEEDFELKEVEEVLERDHYGLEKVKARILEQMAVMKLRKDMKAPILCLYGPPGVGKTSLGKSIAEALGRKYARVALGGVHDEAEIRGHRRTYLGAMPGRIMAALERCGTSNPVLVLDEIDKLGKGIKGDPSTALLEVMDPEQNVRFHDNYIDYDYDLSKILFIATANDLSNISAPLLDRMELIEIGSYVEDEKVEIAIRHLVPKALKELGLDKEGEEAIKFSKDAIRELIQSYTRESGVRQLDRKIHDTLRKIARKVASGEEFDRNLTPESIRNLLGRPDIDPETYEESNIPGIVIGLAWTQSGGDILYIESSLSPGKGERLTLTGNLGDVMKESAMIALQFLKANAKEIGIPAEKFSTNDVHIHVPEGAIPKDGPSAGITMLTSLASSFTGRKVRPRIAMTGEFTLRGRVLPVGGIKEKILAAKRAGISEIILSGRNRKDIEDIKKEYIEGMTFHFVESASEVLDIALLPSEG